MIRLFILTAVMVSLLAAQPAYAASGYELKTDGWWIRAGALTCDVTAPSPVSFFLDADGARPCPGLPRHQVDGGVPIVTISCGD